MNLSLGPITPGGAWSFGLAASVAVGLTSAILGALLMPDHHRALLTGAIFGFVVLGAGLVFPTLFPLLYRVWNRAIRIYSDLARWAVTAVCFFTVFVITAQAGSSLRIKKRRENESLWTAHSDRNRKPTACQYVKEQRSTSAGVAEVAEWAGYSGNAWVFALIPFFCLLLLLEPDTTYEATPDIYTLF